MHFKIVKNEMFVHFVAQISSGSSQNWCKTIRSCFFKKRFWFESNEKVSFIRCFKLSILKTFAANFLDMIGSWSQSHKQNFSIDLFYTQFKAFWLAAQKLQTIRALKTIVAKNILHAFGTWFIIIVSFGNFLVIYRKPHDVTV